MEHKNPPGLDYLFQLSYGYWKSQILFTAVEFGLFTLVNNGLCTARDVAQMLHADERAAETFLNGLASLDLLVKQGNSYHNSPLSDKYLVKGKPLYMGDSVHHFHNIMENWTMLRETIETGKAVSLRDLPEDVDPHDLRDFITAMHNIASAKADDMCRKVALKGAKALLDVAGGPGTYAIALAKANPELRAVVFDLSHVVTLTREFITAAGMEERVTVQAGNCLEEGFGENAYDAVLVSNVLHIYNPANNVKILKKCWNALKPGGQVIIHEFVLDDAKTRPQFAALFSLNMLIGTQEGASYSESEYRNWLAEVGFKDIRRVDMESYSALILGRK